MKKFSVFVAMTALVAMIAGATFTAFAAEPVDLATDTITAEATEIATEAPTEAATEATTEAPKDMETIYNAEQDRDWLIDAIKKAKPEEVEFIKGYIEDALVAMEGLNYTDWEWAYKIASDNAEWIACMIVGVGFIAAAVVAVIKYRREKLLINNAVGAVSISEREMHAMVAKLDTYEGKYEDMEKKIGEALERLDKRDVMLEEAGEFIRGKEKDNLAATNHDIDAMILLADVVNELIQLSNIPQVKKDAIYSKHETAKAAILKQMEGIKDEKPED